MCNPISNDVEWKNSIRKQLERELNDRVRDALKTPEKIAIDNQPKLETRRKYSYKQIGTPRKEDVQLFEKSMPVNKVVLDRELTLNYNTPTETLPDPQSYVFQDKLSHSNYDQYAGVFDIEGLGLQSSQRKFSAGFPKPNQRELISNQKIIDATVIPKSDEESRKSKALKRHLFQYTRTGFKEALASDGRLADGSKLIKIPNKTDKDSKRLSERIFNEKTNYLDRYGIQRNIDGPFWPVDYGPFIATPIHRIKENDEMFSTSTEPLSKAEVDNNSNNNNKMGASGKWRCASRVVYDASSNTLSPPNSSAHSTASLTDSDWSGRKGALQFESRFESGNLQQARRVGEYDYELVLRVDLYTKRHTQWYYFRVSNMRANVQYTFRIVNLLKRDSLYRHGMKPLMYSEKKSKQENIGWVRVGHNINYTTNTCFTSYPLLNKEINYRVLEWKMEFPCADDVCYFAHCYPYTYTDLKRDLNHLTSDPSRSSFISQEVLCETRAGNSCFVLTVTNPDVSDKHKQGIVATARVHPGETNASWMMKGLLEFITGNEPKAKELRNTFIFKIIPMLNPDGVIVGNYRCSLAARDMNRNYKNPKKSAFPTIWHMKSLLETFSRNRKVLVYCDMHGHSRKHNVFMYGCNRKPLNDSWEIASEKKVSWEERADTLVKERVFPWLMSRMAPDKFIFNGCKFQMRKCKQSTGRVVVFRQMQILNSFTMEATFSGTTLCKSEKRHFNQLDFQKMGQVFSEVALEYKHTLENKLKNEAIATEITIALIQQFLLQSSPVKNSQDKQDFSNSENIGSLSMSSLSSHMKSEKENINSLNNLLNQSNTEKQEIGSQLNSNRCLNDYRKILANINMNSVENESSSSDSNSDTDPEGCVDNDSSYQRNKSANKRKVKKKIKKSKKMETRKIFRKTSSIVSTLPSICITDNNKKIHENVSSLNATTTNAMSSQQKNIVTFVSKFAGRSNGGIPCYSQERSKERNLKRIDNIEKEKEQELICHKVKYKAELDDLFQSEKFLTNGLACNGIYNQLLRTSNKFPMKLENIKKVGEPGYKEKSMKSNSVLHPIPSSKHSAYRISMTPSPRSTTTGLSLSEVMNTRSMTSLVTWASPLVIPNDNAAESSSPSYQDLNKGILDQRPLALVLEQTNDSSSAICSIKNCLANSNMKRCQSIHRSDIFDRTMPALISTALHNNNTPFQYTSKPYIMVRPSTAQIGDRRHSNIS